MSFYIYQLVEPLILPNTLISLSDISHQLSAIRYKLSVISYQLAYKLFAVFTKQSLNNKFD
jgi:hypothetical protein